jgi:iron uptake system component EfeO
MLNTSAVRRALAILAATSLVVLAACGDDDGSDVRNSTEGASASGSGSASASGSGSGSGSGISVDTSKTSDDPAVAEAVAQYTAYVKGQVDTLITDTKTFTDAVRAGDVEAAKAAFASSRYAWEAIEPIAGLVSDIDGAVDARVDDFENEDDPAWTGWHKLEYLLWVKGDISAASGAPKLADQLDSDLQKLKSDVSTLEIPPAAIPSGAAELIEEVSGGKITGEEDRYSHTDLSDFAANVEGSQKAWELLKPAVEAKDADLAKAIDDGFAEINAQLATYKDGDGYKSYEELTDADKTAMKATLADLSENLSQVGGVLGLA